MSTIYTDSSVGRGDFDKGYPQPEKALFFSPQNFELDLQNIKKRTGNFAKRAATDGAPPPKKQSASPRDEKNAKEPEKPKIPGKRVVRKQVPLPK